MLVRVIPQLRELRLICDEPQRDVKDEH